MVLFPRIRRRSKDIDDTLDDLSRQHADSRPHLDNLKTVLGRMEADIPGALQEFAAKVSTYAAIHYKHMSQEESVVLPKACEVLTPRTGRGSLPASPRTTTPCWTKPRRTANGSVSSFAES
jgi:hemerythrin-like domain-containing protein